MHEFSLEGHAFIPLNQLLKSLGLCDSGANAKQVVADGHVKVNGIIELRKRCKIIAGHIVEFAGEKISVVQ